MVTLDKYYPDWQTPTTAPASESAVSDTATVKTGGTPLRPEHAQLYADCQKRYIEVEELMEFAVEKGKLDPPSLAVEVKNLKQVLFYLPESAITGEQLCQAEALLEVFYAKIAHLVAPVTIETLRATSSDYLVMRPWWSSWLLGSFSVGRNFLRQLFWIGLALLLTMFAAKYFRMAGHIKTSTDSYLVAVSPFLFGAIGAWIYLYKILTERYLSRCLDPQERPTYLLRLFMGALAGGLIVHFVMPIAPVSPDSMNIRIGENPLPQDNAARTTLGLLAGYSVDFFYNMLDRLIQTALSSNKEKENQTGRLNARQIELEILLKHLHKADNETDKTTIRMMLEKL